MSNSNWVFDFPVGKNAQTGAQPTNPEACISSVGTSMAAKVFHPRSAEVQSWGDTEQLIPYSNVNIVNSWYKWEEFELILENFKRY